MLPKNTPFNTGDVVAKAPSTLRRIHEVSLTPAQIASVEEAMSKLTTAPAEDEAMNKMFMAHLSPSPSSAYASYFGSDGAMLTPHSVVVAYEADRSIAKTQLTRLGLFSEPVQKTTSDKLLDTTVDASKPRTFTPQ